MAEKEPQRKSALVSTAVIPIPAKVFIEKGFSPTVGAYLFCGSHYNLDKCREYGNFFDAIDGDALREFRRLQTANKLKPLDGHVYYLHKGDNLVLVGYCYSIDGKTYGEFVKQYDRAGASNFEQWCGDSAADFIKYVENNILG